MGRPTSLVTVASCSGVRSEKNKISHRSGDTGRSSIVSSRRSMVLSIQLLMVPQKRKNGNPAWPLFFQATGRAPATLCGPTVFCINYRASPMQPIY